jgi:hypothetical protein
MKLVYYILQVLDYYLFSECTGIRLSNFLFVTLCMKNHELK